MAKSAPNSSRGTIIAASVACLVIGAVIGYFLHDCGDFSRCDSFQQTSFVVGCYTDLAVKNKDTSICDRIPGDFYTETCYEEVSKVLMEESVCEQLTDSSKKDACYFRVGIYKKSAALCEKIFLPQLRSDCLRDVGASGEISSGDGETVQNKTNQTQTTGTSTSVAPGEENAGIDLAIPSVYQCGSGICFQIKTPVSNKRDLNLSAIRYSVAGSPKTIAYWSGTGTACASLEALTPNKNCFARIEDTYCLKGDHLTINLTGNSSISGLISGCK
ncbi:MAG: hypothetical protein JW727_01385 [Candidatus Aenigmarchaeota archaeon]|nr:hypothetical protein [Candidatus Aenigmarchaeota archaeon]